MKFRKKRRNVLRLLRYLNGFLIEAFYFENDKGLTIDLERTEDEKEAIETRIANYERDLEKLKFENENCFGREKNSLMVLSGFTSQTEFLSYVLKPDGSESPRTIKIPSSKNEYHYLYASISALIRGKIYIFGEGGNLDYGLRVKNAKKINLCLF